MRDDSFAMPEKAIVPCPTCGLPATFFADPVGPFCSNRCKQIDLGKWLGEEYRVSEPLTAEHFAEYEQLEGDELDKPET